MKGARAMGDEQRSAAATTQMYEVVGEKGVARVQGSMALIEIYNLVGRLRQWKRF